MLETYRGTVYPNELDHMGHMNVQYYVNKFDQATWQLFGALGIGMNYMKTHSLALVALEQNIKYQRELLSGELIYIRTNVLELKAKIMVFEHTMYNAETGEVAAICRLTGIAIDRNTRKSRVMPAEVVKAIEQKFVIK
jgi:acyl-CoA thioester hydrolase